MIIENQASVTEAVTEAFGRTADPRVREILLALVRHLHGFIREVRLTEREFLEATRLIAAMGQRTTDSHNEVVLMAGSLGVSALVCLLNNGDNGQTETQANLLGPFWREDQPLCASDDTLVRSATPGPALVVDVRVEDGAGRPAHLHFMIYKPGFKTLISQIYVPDDEHIDSDVQFGVTRALIGGYVCHNEPEAKLGFKAPWYSLDQRFVLERGEARRPRPPIRSKAEAR